MASFFRRRRSLLVKAIIVIPVLWFLAVLLLGHAPSLSLPGSREEEEEGRGGRGLLPPFFKNTHSPPKKEAPLHPPRDAHRGKGEDDGKEVVQFRNVAAEEEDLRRRKGEEDRKRKEEAEEQQRRRKEAALKYEAEKKARQVDPNAPGEENPASS